MYFGHVNAQQGVCSHFALAVNSTDMLTLPLSAEVYRFLSASSAYRFTIQIFRFLSNLPLSNHWVLFTPSDWDWVTVCHHYINVMTLSKHALCNLIAHWINVTGQALVLVLPTYQRKRTDQVHYFSLPSSLSINWEIVWLYKYWHMF